MPWNIEQAFDQSVKYVTCVAMVTKADVAMATLEIIIDIVVTILKCHCLCQWDIFLCYWLK